MVDSARWEQSRVADYVPRRGLPGDPGRVRAVETLLQICVRLLSRKRKGKDHNVAREIDQPSGFMLVSGMDPCPFI
jgi:hypothetical protein